MTYTFTMILDRGFEGNEMTRQGLQSYERNEQRDKEMRLGVKCLHMRAHETINVETSTLSKNSENV